VVEGNNIPEDSESLEEELGSDTPKYEDKVIFESEREVKLDDYKPATKTIDEEEESSVSISDKQAILKVLRPKYKDAELNEVLQSAMSSRVFPDNIMDKHFLLSAYYIEKHIYDKGFNPVFSISMIQDALTIGFEGRHIADLLELAGAESTEDLDKISKSLGL
jgi:intein-encoded DNA endonuclease-like protein